MLPPNEADRGEEDNITQKQVSDARRVASYSLAAAAVSALAFSLLALIAMEPMLKLLGASSNTLPYAKQYVLTTTVFGGLPTILAMAMPQLLRNAGFSKEAGIGVGLGSLLNVLLDPLFMFVLLPKGSEVLGAGIATMLSNVCSLLYFILMFRKLRDQTVLSLPRGIEKIGRDHKRSLYSVGIPAAIAIFFFDLVTIVINRLTASYGDTALAAMGIVLKLERIPIQVGLGVCLGMVPLVAYNYGAGNGPRMRQFVSLARFVILVFSCACALLFWLLAEPLVSAFIADGETVSLGVSFLRGRCLSLPFMMIGYHIVNYMNAVDRGKVSFLLALIRHILLIIPIMILMNRIWGLNGLIWSQLVADFLNAVIAFIIFRRVDSGIVSAQR